MKTNTVNNIRYPLIELTGWVFKEEKVFFEIEEYPGIHKIKKKDIPQHYARHIVDSNGFIIKITSHEVLGEIASFSTFFSKPYFEVRLTIENSGVQMPLEELKQIVLSKLSELFHITYNKIMTPEEFQEKIKAAKDYYEVIVIATFLDQ